MKQGIAFTVACAVLAGAILYRVGWDRLFAAPVAFEPDCLELATFAESSNGSAGWSRYLRAGCDRKFHANAIRRAFSGPRGSSAFEWGLVRPELVGLDFKGSLIDREE